MRYISFCVTTWNRFDYTVRCIDAVIDFPEIDEIIISDDASTDGSYERLVDYYSGNIKVKIYRNDINANCYHNKALAISRAHNKFVILLDSDNRIDRSYIDAIYKEDWDYDIILTPEFLRPNFDFRQYGGLVLTSENIASYIDLPLVETVLNAANFFVNRKNYLDVFDVNVSPVTSDSITQAYNWLAAGKKIKILQGLTYWHEVHPQSHYITQNNLTPQGYHNQILQQLRELR